MVASKTDHFWSLSSEISLTSIPSLFHFFLVGLARNKEQCFLGSLSFSSFLVDEMCSPSNSFCLTRFPFNFNEILKAKAWIEVFLSRLKSPDPTRSVPRQPSQEEHSSDVSYKTRLKG